MDQNIRLPDASSPPCWPAPQPECGSPGLSAGAADCTTSHHKTHSTAAGDEVTVVYAWHSWAGRPVRLHEVIERATGASARCSLVDATIARLQEIPTWMLQSRGRDHRAPAGDPDLDARCQRMPHRAHDGAAGCGLVRAGGLARPALGCNARRTDRSSD